MEMRLFLYFRTPGGGEVGNRYINILNIIYYMNRQLVCSDVGSQLA